MSCYGPLPVHPHSSSQEVVCSPPFRGPPTEGSPPWAAIAWPQYGSPAPGPALGGRLDPVDAAAEYLKQQIARGEHQSASMEDNFKRYALVIEDSIVTE